MRALAAGERGDGVAEVDGEPGQVVDPGWQPEQGVESAAQRVDLPHEPANGLRRRGVGLLGCGHRSALPSVSPGSSAPASANQFAGISHSSLRTGSRTGAVRSARAAARWCVRTSRRRHAG